MGFLTSIEWRSLLVWTAAFLFFELPSKDVWGIWPWYSLSTTVTTGVRWWWPIALYVVLFMVVLAGHFIFDYSYKWVVGVALLGVALIVSHLIGHAVGRYV